MSSNICKTRSDVGAMFNFFPSYAYGLTTLNKPKSKEVSTNDGIITQNIFDAAVPTFIETK